MAQSVIDFDMRSPERLAAAGFKIDFDHRRTFYAEFSLERPCVIQSSVHTELPFSMGAFSASYGGRLRGINIGRYCSISGDVQTGWDDHPSDWVSSSMAGYVEDIHGWASLTGWPDRLVEHRFSSLRGLTTIGNDVRIGHGAFLRAGVTVGDGAIVAARSVVLDDVEPYTIVAGCPARVKRLRYTAELTTKMMRLRWWRYNIFQFEQKYLSDPSKFVMYFEDLQSRGQLEHPYDPGQTTAQDLGGIAGVPIFFA